MAVFVLILCVLKKKLWLHGFVEILRRKLCKMYTVPFFYNICKSRINEKQGKLKLPFKMPILGVVQVAQKIGQYQKSRASSKTPR